MSLKLGDFVVVMEFLNWLKRQGVVITIAPMLDREPDAVYKTDDDMLQLAKRYVEAKW